MLGLGRWGEVLQCVVYGGANERCCSYGLVYGYVVGFVEQYRKLLMKDRMKKRLVYGYVGYCRRKWEAISGGFRLMYDDWFGWVIMCVRQRDNDCLVLDCEVIVELVMVVGSQWVLGKLLEEEIESCRWWWFFFVSIYSLAKTW